MDNEPLYPEPKSQVLEEDELALKNIKRELEIVQQNELIKIKHSLQATKKECDALVKETTYKEKQV